ncbi:unnamed protein product [Symbiodinium sp. CCMP2592]|nr:unnamed protein product [Symbiodinium sp. CCMP2592]
MAPKTADPKSAVFERVRMEPLPEHMYEEVIDMAALSDLTEAEVRRTGVQSNLVALHLQENGLTMIRPTADPPMANASATGPAAIDAALGITVRNGAEEPASARAADAAPAANESVPGAPVPSEPNAAVNAVPWEARHLVDETMVQHRLSRRGPVTVEMSAALTAMDSGVELARVWNELDSYITTVVENESENDEPLVFVVFRRNRSTAMRHWVAGGTGGNARMKLASYFNRQFTDHISTFEWDGNGHGPNDWRWTINGGTVPRDPKLLLSLNEIIEWGMLATNRGDSLLEWRLTGRTMVPLCQSIGTGLEHDCSTWDEICENEEHVAATAWNACKGKANEQAVGNAREQTANALEPSSEIVLRKNAKGTVK